MANSVIEIAAPAKINLTLKVLGRRDDGYHLLDSLVAFASVHDRLRLTVLGPGESDRLHLTGPEAAGLADTSTADNLVSRAITAFRAATGWDHPVEILLEKHLPAAAGLGGGSADAAAALIGVNQLAGQPMDDAALAEIGARLGADVPVCLISSTSRMTGIGEVIHPAPLIPRCGLLLANPRVQVPTGTVFQRLDGHYSTVKGAKPHWYDLKSLIEFLTNHGGNDLTRPAGQLVDIIQVVLEKFKALPGVRSHGMSGSGASCFALFNTAEQAADAARDLAAAQPDWWIRPGQLHDWSADRIKVR